MKCASFALFLYLACASDCLIPRKLFPIKYDLTVTPFFETETESSFDGNLIFTFKPLRHHTVTLLALHADGLDVESYVLLEDNNNSTKQLDVNIEYDSELQLLSFYLGYPLSVDNTYELHINYTGKITDDGWGLYKGFYEHNGKKRFYTVSQLRPVFGRRLLPCLDEPSYKACFTLRVWRLPNYTAVSNMPRVDTTPRNLVTGRVLDTFAETPPMSVFLLALAVFDFSSLTFADKKFTSWTVPTKLYLAEHGQKMIPNLVKAMEDIVGSKFPLPKMDQIALPQLNPVAMENWGMNTYREGFLLYQEGKFAPRVRQDVPRFTAHEVTHHWLGNLVTLQWWDWLWISEMYAMYYEYYLPSQVEPSWRMTDQMVIDLYLPGLLEDSFSGSKPLTTQVSNNTEILAKFSGVTYTKGPALVRMIDHFLSHSRAEEALRMLISEKKYGTVNPTELWKIYDQKAERLPAPMETIMNSWTEQPGYPLVTVSQSEGSVTLRQERFLMDGNTSDCSLWWIPLTYTSGLRPDFNRTQTRVWLPPQEAPTCIKLGSHIDSWLLFNIQYIGFYRVNYDQQNWERLVQSLHSNPASIHELNRAQLLDDSLSLARASRLPYPTALQLMSYLVREGCYFPWAAVLPSVQFLMSTLNGYPELEDFKGYVRQLISPTYQSVGYHLGPSDPHLLQLHRVQVVTLACAVGLPACVQAAQRLHNSSQQPVVAPGLEAVQLCTVLETGVTADQLTEESQVTAMPCVQDKAVFSRYLHKSLQEDTTAEWTAKLAAALTRLANVQPMFTLMVDQYQVLLSRFGASSVADHFTRVGRYLSTHPQLIKLEDLRTEVKDSEVASALSTVAAGLDSRLKWIEKHLPSIKSWLTTFSLSHPNNTPDTLVYCS